MRILQVKELAAALRALSFVSFTVEHRRKLLATQFSRSDLELSVSSFLVARQNVLSLALPAALHIKSNSH